MADDFRANTRTTGSVAVGGETAGVIEKKRDTDWFAVELVAGRTYVVDVEGDGGGALDAMLRGLYDGAGRRIAGTRDNDGGEGSNARLTFTATEDGTHYIAARGEGGTTGAYTVRVTADPDATAAGATALGDLAAQDGARVRRDAVDGAADEADYYRFTLSEARTVKLGLRDQDADADLHLEDADGNVVASSTRGGTRNEGIEETLQAGTYYVRVAAREAGENSYALRYRAAEPDRNSGAVSEPRGEDLPADTSTQGRLGVGDFARGKIATRGDIDWFAVVLEAGKTYQIDVKGADSGKGTLKDPILEGIFDADGNAVAGAYDDGGSDNRDTLVIFTPDADATYYLAVSGWGRGTYTVQVGPGDAEFDAVLSGPETRAGPTGYAGLKADITYSFNGGSPEPGDDVSVRGNASNYQVLDAESRAQVRMALDEWAKAADITFTEVTQGESDINFWFADLSAGRKGGQYHHPSGRVDYDHASAGSAVPGSLWYQVYLHEIGHALGLRHPETNIASVMNIDSPGTHKGLSAADENAVQYLYGIKGGAVNVKLLNLEYLSNDADSYVGTPGQNFIYANDGNDILRLGGGKDMAFGGEGHDRIRGESGDDRIYGESGNDRIDGGGGADILEGGRGKDDLYGGEGADVFVYRNADEGRDVIFDFDPSEDRLHIYGAKISGVSTSGGDTLVKLSSGTRIELADVQVSEDVADFATYVL